MPTKLCPKCHGQRTILCLACHGTGIVIELIIERCVDRVDRSDYEQHVAVCGRAHDRLGGDIAAATWPILHDELLTKPLRQPLSDQAREDVLRTAGGKADHDAHRPRRIGLCSCNPRYSRQRGSACGQMQKCTAGKFPSDLPSHHSITSSARASSARRRQLMVASDRPLLILREAVRKPLPLISLSSRGRSHSGCHNDGCRNRGRPRAVAAVARPHKPKAARRSSLRWVCRLSWEPQVVRALPLWAVRSSLHWVRRPSSEPQLRAAPPQRVERIHIRSWAPRRVPPRC